MSYAFGQRSNPSWDALRTQSLQGGPQGDRFQIAGRRLRLDGITLGVVDTQTLYIDPAGYGDYTTLQAALDALPSLVGPSATSWSIVLRNGTYVEPLIFKTAATGYTLTIIGWGEVIIHPSGSWAWDTNGGQPSTVTFRNIQLGVVSNTYHLFFSGINGQTVVFDNCPIAVPTGIYRLLGGNATLVFQHCTLSGEDTLSFQGSVLVTAIDCFLSGSGNVVYTQGGQTFDLYGCVIANTGAGYDLANNGASNSLNVGRCIYNTANTFGTITPKDGDVPTVPPASIGPGSAQYQYLVTGATPFTPAWSSGFLNIASGKTLTVQNALTLSGTDGGALSLAVPNTKTLTLTVADSYNLTVPATGTAALTNYINTGNLIGSGIVSDTQSIVDDFERADTVGTLGVAPTGQTWSMTGPGATTGGITSGRMVSPAPDTLYAYMAYAHKNIRAGGEFSFVAGGGSGNTAIVIAPSADAALIDNCVHFGITQTGWFLQLRISNVSYNLTSGSFASPLSLGTVYKAFITVYGNTVSLELPDGSVAAWTDSRVDALYGQYVFWEITSGLTTILPRWESVECRQINAGVVVASPASILFGDTTGIATTSPLFLYDTANKKQKFVPTGYSDTNGINVPIYGSSNRGAFIEVIGEGDFRSHISLGVNKVQSDTDAVECMRIASNGYVNFGAAVAIPGSQVQATSPVALGAGEQQVVTLMHYAGATNDGVRITLSNTLAQPYSRNAEIASLRTGAGYQSNMILRINAGAAYNDVIDAVTIPSSGNVLIGTATDGMTTGGSLAIAKDLAHRGTLAGFFNTSPAAQQTGNIVAGLNNLGLFSGASLKLSGIHASTPITYISGTGTAGTDNTAMTIKTVTLPANSLTQVGDRMRIRSYFAATAGAPAVGTTKLNGVTTANTSVSGTNLALTECWIHYIDNTHANIIENENGALGNVSAPNVSGFSWNSNQDIIFTQDAVVSQHLVLYALIIDVFPKGV